VLLFVEWISGGAEGSRYVWNVSRIKGRSVSAGVWQEGCRHEM